MDKIEELKIEIPQRKTNFLRAPKILIREKMTKKKLSIQISQKL